MRQDTSVPLRHPKAGSHNFDPFPDAALGNFPIRPFRVVTTSEPGIATAIFHITICAGHSGLQVSMRSGDDSVMTRRATVASLNSRSTETLLTRWLFK